MTPKTLFESFNKVGCEDPLSKFQAYSGGFKSYLKSLSEGKAGPGEMQELIVNSVHLNQGSPLERQDSGYTSPHRYGGLLPSLADTALQPKPVTEVRAGRAVARETPALHTIRILLMFAGDAATTAQTLVNSLQDFQVEELPSLRVDLFRLNEVDLWNSLLVNPEACLMKWVEEFDFVMPLLSPQLLQDLHNSSLPAGPPAPTSAMINKYLYTLLRTEFVAAGCQNLKVRPAIPVEFVPQLARARPLTTEPLFKMWKN